MTARTTVLKTYKLFIGGAFPRSESGRSIRLEGAKGDVIAEICRASRKDLRDAVESARKALPGWAARSGYNRGQILYRMAEMIEARHGEFVDRICETSIADSKKRRSAAKREVDAAVDRLVCFAGWTDKFTQILGGQNPVAGPFYTFTVPEPTGVVACIVPPQPPLLALISLVAPAICAGNTVVAIVPAAHPLAALTLGEVIATSDVPGGTINVLSGHHEELLEQVAAHRGINAVCAAGLDRESTTTLRKGTADNLKRVRVIDVRKDEEWFNKDRFESPWMIEPLTEMKTIWHPDR